MISPRRNETRWPFSATPSQHRTLSDRICARRPARFEQFGQRRQYVVALEMELAALDEAVGLDGSRIFRPKPDARPIVQPQPPARFGCLCGTLSHSPRQIRSTRLRFTCHP